MGQGGDVPEMQSLCQRYTGNARLQANSFQLNRLHETRKILSTSSRVEQSPHLIWLAGVNPVTKPTYDDRTAREGTLRLGFIPVCHMPRA